MSKVEYGLAAYDRISGTISEPVHMGLGDDPIDAKSIPHLLEIAASRGWELCGTMPGSIKGRSMPDLLRKGELRKVEDCNETTLLMFKRASVEAKRQDFLWAVQTAILTNSMNLASQPELATKYRHVISATGVLGLMQDALYASDRIPDELEATEAAGDFCGYMLQNLRDIEERARETSIQVPGWFSRP